MNKVFHRLWKEEATVTGRWFIDQYSIMHVEVIQGGWFKSYSWWEDTYIVELQECTK